MALTAKSAAACRAEQSGGEALLARRRRLSRESHHFSHIREYGQPQKISSFTRDMESSRNLRTTD